jgi:hypothetical protein
MVGWLGLAVRYGIAISFVSIVTLLGLLLSIVLKNIESTSK